jgi:carboxymethylenebutenolidase
VVVLMEGNGISPQLLRVCERLAAAGYNAIAPDLYARFGGSDPDKAMEHLGQLQEEDALADIGEAVAELRRRGSRRVGITGFCMGGYYSYRAAVGLPAGTVDAAVPFYGSRIGKRLGEPTCPLLAFFGGTDEWIPRDEIAAAEAHHPGKVVVYPDAGHGFMRDGSVNHDPAAADDAWARTLAFFAEHLRGD